MLVAKGLPGFIAYGVLAGEVVAPCLLIVGILTRPAALVLAFTMVVAWLMVGTGKTFALDAVGAWAIESLVYFFVGALAIAFLGAGRYSIGGNSAAVSAPVFSASPRPHLVCRGVAARFSDPFLGRYFKILIFNIFILA